METDKNQEKIFDIQLTETEIAIVKAGLQYFRLADNYGYALWGTVPSACFCSHDAEYALRVGNIYKKLTEKAKVKPDYGYWCEPKRIAKVCIADYKIAKKENEKVEKKMYEDYLRDNSIIDEIEKHGLNGREILENANKVYSEKVKVDEEAKKKADKESNKKL